MNSSITYVNQSHESINHMNLSIISIHQLHDYINFNYMIVLIIWIHQLYESIEYIDLSYT